MRGQFLFILASFVNKMSLLFPSNLPPRAKLQICVHWVRKNEGGLSIIRNEALRPVGGASRKCSIIYIVPLTPPSRRGLRGTCRSELLVD